MTGKSESGKYKILMWKKRRKKNGRTPRLKSD